MPSPTLVISEIYGGGSDSAASVYKYDYIVLHNNSNQTIDINGWSVQTVRGNAFWNSYEVTNINGSIPAGGYFLVRLGRNGNTDNGADLPTPDAVGTAYIGSGTGRAVIVTTRNPVSDADPQRSDIVDRVGYGPMVRNYEGGAPAPLASLTMSVSRINRGTQDTDDNSKDFIASTPNPRNSQSSTYIACYCTGTRIRTIAGDTPVEILAVGDIVVTASGAQRPIIWIGSRNLDAGTRPLPESQQPVRIRANAFGSSLPASDLLVSSQHAIMVGPEHGAMGEALVPAAALINGATIIREPMASVTYWHVELDAHDILIANGQPAESYLAVGNRGFFADADGLGDPSPDAPSSCLPRTDDPEKLRPVRAWLRAQAEALGWQIKTTDLFAGLRLVADGAVFMPETRGLSARVLVPAGAQEVWLVSGASVPWEVSDAGDARRLGLCVSGLSVSDGWGASMSLALDDPELTDGWHVTEAHGEGALRWTDGRARLPASLWDGSTAVFLRIDLVRPSLPAWWAPAELLAASAETGGHLRPVFA